MSEDDEQPDIIDPVIHVGCHIYSAPDLSSHRGTVQQINDNDLIIDFYDWVAQVPIDDIRVMFLPPLLVLVAIRTGIKLATYGTSKNEE